jgi:predicted enzyme related to lactoylglutathione lyase
MIVVIMAAAILDTAFTSLTGAGGRPVWPPADAVKPGARFAYVADPEGNLLELIQPPRGSAPAA